MVQSFSDPLAVAMLRDYNRLLKQEAAATESIQRVRKAPKVLKGGARVTKKPEKLDGKTLRQDINQLPLGQRKAAEEDALNKLVRSRMSS
jgi:hypothetical protein